MNFLLHVKIASKSVSALGGLLFTSHHIDAMICRKKSCFYCTFTLHYGTHYRYLAFKKKSRKQYYVNGIFNTFLETTEVLS